ncbi:MAG: lamin tail domain-containing protein [Acidobacteriota bacterium]
MYKRLLATCVLVVVLLAASPAAASLLRIYYPDIEQGSATLIVGPAGKAMLIDAGTGMNPTDDDIVELIRDLEDQGIVTDLAYTLATHYDEDHIGRMDDVLNFGIMAPLAIAYDRGTTDTPSTFTYADYAVAAANHTRTAVTATTSFDLGGGVTVRCYVHNGELPNGTSVSLTGTDQQENARSASVVVTHGDVHVWIGGDLTGNDDTKNFADVETGVSTWAGDVDIYTFNHHGSDSSTAQDFIDVLKAEVGIVQSSANNSHGHPRANVLDRFGATPDTDGNDPIIIQQNPGDPDDTRSDDSKADYIVDPDDDINDEPFALPGTITLVSDGTSYQIFGGDLDPLTYGADAGLATIGDYPPAIVWVDRDKRVPTSSQTTVVSAEVHDDGTLSSVEIVYSVDGVAQTDIAMTQVGTTDVWQGTIPVQLDGAQVSYRVEATDNLTQTGSSFSQGFFQGTTDIADLRTNDPDGLLEPMRYQARVRGTLTVEAGIFHPTVSQVWVEDSTGGVQIFDRGLLGHSRGDLIDVVGSLEQFGGQTQLNISQDWGNFGTTLVSSGSAPSAAVKTLSQIGEALEGQLVRIDNVSISSGAIYGSGNSSLTISDGTGSTTLRVDQDTDIPGVNTPTQSFDIIGIVGQYDDHPFTSGYQILPREKTDFVSDEVNVPDVIISEIHADPHGTEGDANGDGVISSSHDEFIELWNTTYGDVDISGWEIHDGTGLRAAFPADTVIPPREIVVVFGGGTPAGDFGNAMDNGLVFGGYLGLNNTGDTVTLKDDLGVTVQSVTYGSEGGDDQSLTRPDTTNAPMQKHTVADTVDGSRYSPGTTIFGQPLTVAAGAVIITEVLYDPSGADGELEWVELCNTTDQAIDLSTMSLGWGGGDYTSGQVTLAGTIPANGVWIVGGPTSSTDNASPTIDDPVEFSPGIQNSGTTADGVALFNFTKSHVDGTTVPVDNVIYGINNSNDLIDTTGAIGTVDVGDATSGRSIERTALGTWQIQTSPTPNSSPACGGSGSGGTPDLVLTEVYYDASGGDNGLEWIEIKNIGTGSADLSGYSLGWGGGDYTYGTLQLSGTLAAGAVFVVGGTTSNGDNHNPTFDQSANFSPDLQNSGSVADGVALFDVPETSITALTVPIDAVVYGTTNSNGLIDETGSASTPEVGDAPAGDSIERTDAAGSWQIQGTPNPGSSSV